jgi:ATP-dependent Clp protease ATP-binding subunit ClpB
LKASDEVINKLAELGYDPQFGARPVKRIMQKEVVNELSKQLLAGKVSVGEDLVLDEFDGKYVFRKPIEQDVMP